MRTAFAENADNRAAFGGILVLLVAALVSGCSSKCQRGRHLEGGVCVRDAASIAGAGGVADGSSGTTGGSGAGSVSDATSGTSTMTSGGPTTSSTVGNQSVAGNGAGGNEASSSLSQTVCTAEGSKRCSGTSAVEACGGGQWTAEASCASGQVCTSSGPGQAECIEVLAVCCGREGSSVCDGQGILTKCNSDGSAGGTEQCDSAALCQASVSGGTCRKCMTDEHRCVGAALEVCAMDGSGFVKQRDCDSEALCNALVGDCTMQVCIPQETACQDNTLVTCNDDGSAVASMTPCNEMTCDAEGKDCNACTPGQKQCEGDVAMTCAESGQNFEPMPCGSGKRCTGEGECVDCIEDSDCSELTEGCSVGACQDDRCSPRAAPSGMACMTAQGKPGTCSSGMCRCTPQCNKECGDDGCGAQCPACGGGRECVNDKCVECRTDSDCRDLNSDNGCVAGRCSNGTCMPSNTTGSCRTDRDASGRCTAGQCVCVPGQGCAGKCGDALDTCNIPCGDRCTGDQVCDGDRCANPQPTGVGLYEECLANGKPDCGSGMACEQFNTSTSVCWREPPCILPQTQAFTVCAQPCGAGTTASCPSGTSCDGAWCVPTEYLP
jgi:hypothetical protein